MIINCITKKLTSTADIFYLAHYINQSYWLCMFKYQGTATVFNVNFNEIDFIYDELNYIAAIDKY